MKEIKAYIRKEKAEVVMTGSLFSDIERAVRIRNGEEGIVN